MTKFTSDPKFRILVSYYYYQDADLEELFAENFKEDWPEVFADSGAVSALTMGVPLDLDAYATWLKRWKHLFAFYANLDVIGSAIKSAENLKRLQDKGLDPMPVYHGGEPYKFYDVMVDKHPLIAVGGIAWTPVGSPQVTRIFIRLFEKAGGVAIHGFGTTGNTTLKRFPWYSTDSGSWLAGFMHARCRIWVPKEAKFKTIILKDANNMASFSSVLQKEYDLSWRDLIIEEGYTIPNVPVTRISVLSVKRCELWLRKAFGKIFIPGREDKGPGPKIFLVTGPGALSYYLKDMDRIQREYVEKREQMRCVDFST